MKSTKWLLINIFFTILFLLIIISLNFYIDTYATRLSLFGIKKEISQMKFMAPINQYIFKTEYIFRDPNRFDSFIFGSSRKNKQRKILQYVLFFRIALPSSGDHQSISPKRGKDKNSHHRTG
jgi:hypothetical protein